MALINQRKELAQFINDHKHYIARNGQLFDIFEGNLKPYVDQILRETLSDQYYSKIKSRIYPINILKRLIDKLSKVYSSKPLRESEQDQETLEMYEKFFQINKKMNTADEFSNLFKGYALEPYVYNGIPKLRVLPFDRFLVKSDDILEPTRMTHFIKFVGKTKNEKGVNVDCWFVYTDEEFMAIDENGNLLKQFMAENGGVNPYGFIPFYYSGKSEYEILPTQDTDTLELAKLLPVQLTDLAGAIMFQCFSIVYGIDVDSENMVMSPNAFWNMKSDPKSDKTPQVGSLKPQADIDKVMSFIKDTFATWLETRGIRVGSLGSTDGQSAQNGISKIIDEMDTFEAVKRQMAMFKVDEYKFWQLVKDLHNKWIEFGELQGVRPLSPDWEVFTMFDEPKPMMDQSQSLDFLTKQLDQGLISRQTALEMLYPDWSEEKIISELENAENDLAEFGSRINNDNNQEQQD